MNQISWTYSNNSFANTVTFTERTRQTDGWNSFDWTSRLVAVVRLHIANTQAARLRQFVCHPRRAWQISVVVSRLMHSYRQMWRTWQQSSPNNDVISPTYNDTSRCSPCTHQRRFWGRGRQAHKMLARPQNSERSLDVHAALRYW